jgi:hypothetical protein
MTWLVSQGGHYVLGFGKGEKEGRADGRTGGVGNKRVEINLEQDEIGEKSG